jgi:hypothetical protein
MNQYMKKEYWGALIFALILIIFSVASTKIMFHDVTEYIPLAKNFAGINNMDLYSTHSLLYPAFIAPFLKVWPSLTMIKLINSLWVFLIGLALLFLLKNKKAFILFAFSPLAWYVSIQTTPVLPASFFFILSWILLIKYQSKKTFILSGIFLGLSCAFYDVLLFVAAIFLLVYFWNRQLKEIILYGVAIGVGLLPRFALDYYLFHNPFYSLIRFFGVNLTMSLGLSSTLGGTSLFSIDALIILVAISPLLYKLYKFNFKENKQHLLFLLIVTLMLFVRVIKLKYFMIIAPIILLFLSEIFNEREIKWHCIISLVITVFLTFSFFGMNEDFKLNQEVNKIVSENQNVSNIISGPYEAPLISIFLWQNNPKIVWFEDFQASLKNQTTIKEYNLQFNSKIPLREKLVFNVKFNRNENKTYNNYIIVAQKGDSLPGFKEEQCYERLCIYSK